jgi:kynureninase
MKSNQQEAQALDAKDPFICQRDLFELPKIGDETCLYFNGNSLGPKPKRAQHYIEKEFAAWAQLGGRGHFYKDEPWVEYYQLLRPSLARLLGTQEHEVVPMGTLTTNLHLGFMSFYRPTAKRYKILRLAGFPSDSYAVDSQIAQRLDCIKQWNGSQPFSAEEALIVLKPDHQGYIDFQRYAEILEQQGDEIALVWLEGLHYFTGQFFDLKKYGALAQQKGCYFGVDLAHAIGNVPLNLHADQVDFAVWCSYKYLSGGPGGISGLYIHQKHHHQTLRLAGWYGHNRATRFAMPDQFDPIPTTEGWILSNPSIVLLANLRAALDIFDQTDLTALREKNLRLNTYLLDLLDGAGLDVQILTPRNPAERGCQLSLRFASAELCSQLAQKLWEHKIIADVRSDVIRVAPMGLYTRFIDVYNLTEKLVQAYHNL